MRLPSRAPLHANVGAPASAFALVTAELWAGACLLCGDELECERLAILRENGLATTKQDRLDREEQFIDEVGREKRPHHRCAPIDVDVSARPLTPLGNGAQKVCAADD